MERYIKQLIQDIRIAREGSAEKKRSMEAGRIGMPDFEKHINRMEEYLEGNGTRLSDVVGLDTSLLPPVDKLNPSQAGRLFNELMALTASYNFLVHFPDGLPATIGYKMLREKWNEEAMFIANGFSGIEFCHYDPAECPFPDEYCECKKGVY